MSFPSRLRAMACGASALLFAAQPLSAQTTQSKRAAISSAKATYTHVEREVAAKRLTRRDTTVVCRGNGVDVQGAIFRDSAGVVRRLEWRGGTDDHTEHLTAYFDSRERARFALVQRGALNGTEHEERVYYDVGGRVVQRLRQRVRGPGYPFGTLTKRPSASGWTRDLCR